jgi:hypothetical protein
MHVTTYDDRDGIMVEYDDQRGWHIEGRVPHVPEDGGPGWVCFDLPAAASKPAMVAILDTLGYTREETDKILEAF